MKTARKLLLAVVALALVAAYVIGPSGVHVIVLNSTDETLQAVQVHVTGQSVFLGDIPPGERQSVRTEPTGESSLAVTVGPPIGRTKALGGYFEPGYRGSILVEVRPDLSIHTTDETRIGLW